jgi:hypothetical protein
VFETHSLGGLHRPKRYVWSRPWDVDRDLMPHLARASKRRTVSTGTSREKEVRETHRLIELVRAPLERRLHQIEIGLTLLCKDGVSRGGGGGHVVL